MYYKTLQKTVIHTKSFTFFSKIFITLILLKEVFISSDYLNNVTHKKFSHFEQNIFYSIYLVHLSAPR